VVAIPFLSGFSLRFLTTTLFTEATPTPYKIGLPAALLVMLVGLLALIRSQRCRARAATAEAPE
jgi:hypothetical protein